MKKDLVLTNHYASTGEPMSSHLPSPWGPCTKCGLAHALQLDYAVCVPVPPTGEHLVDGEFQSDKYPTTPRGKVPLSVKDETAQDLLWEYAQRRRVVDAEFADDLAKALLFAGHSPAKLTPIPMLLWCPECGKRHVDVGEFENKVHHTHACQSCGHVWRPAIVPTKGVQFLPGFKTEEGTPVPWTP